MEKKLHILVAEDDKADTLFIKMIFEKAGLFKRVDIVSNGEELINFLKSSQNPLPDVILTDWNMPRMNADEVLKEISSDKNLNNIPIILFSTSDYPSLKEKSKEMGATSFIVKPHTLEEYTKIPEKVFSILAESKHE